MDGRTGLRQGADQADNEATDSAHSDGPISVEPREIRKKQVSSRPSVSFILLVLAIIVAGAGAITWALVRPEPRTIEIIVPTPGPLVVHVTGEVADPGVYTLQPGSRVSDAIAAAGGLAGASSINLAAPLRDGQQLVIAGEAPEPNPDSTSSSTSATSANANILLDLNNASAVQLEELPNIGPVRAAAIISFRDRNGSILFVDDLTAIDGIGPVIVDALRPLVVQP